MWLATAEEDIQCSECSHTIRSGTNCLSQMPVAIPDGFRRRKYRNFCIECEECKAEGHESSCYVRSFHHWYAYQATPVEPIPCGHCGKAIPGGTRTAAEKLYVWPEPEPVSGSIGSPSHRNGAAFSVLGGTARPSPAAWDNLSRSTRRKFTEGGLRPGMGPRTDAMARRLFEKEVPEPLRKMGEPAVKDFLRGKHVSHIKSVKNAPDQAKWPSNVVLEDGRPNVARGGRNMKHADLAEAKSASRYSAVRAGAKALAKGATKAGFVAALMEAVVSLPENILHHRRGRKSGEQALKDAARDMWTAGRAGFVATAIAKGALVFFPGLATVLPALGVAGAGFLVGTAATRLYKAAKRDLPLDEYHVYPLRAY